MAGAWAPVPGFESGYEVHPTGEIRSIRTGRLMVSELGLNGYARVTLWQHGERRRVSVHRLLALAFLERKQGDTVVRHLDGNRRNNSLQNLAWGTQSQNMFDAVAHGTHPTASKSHCPRGHAYSPENTGTWSGRRNCLTCHRAKATCPVCGKARSASSMRRHLRAVHPGAETQGRWAS